MSSFFVVPNWPGRAARGINADISALEFRLHAGLQDAEVINCVQMTPPNPGTVSGESSPRRVPPSTPRLTHVACVRASPWQNKQNQSAGGSWVGGTPQDFRLSGVACIATAGALVYIVASNTHAHPQWSRDMFGFGISNVAIWIPHSEHAI